MTGGQFFLGLVAIFVATFVYRWQKSIDRETQLQSERRKLYARYVSLLTKEKLSHPMRDDGKSPDDVEAWMRISDGEIAMYAARDELWLLAPKRVVTKLVLCDEAFRDWKIAMSKGLREPNGDFTIDSNRELYGKLNDGIQGLLDAMRNDLDDHGPLKGFQIVSLLRGQCK